MKRLLGIIMVIVLLFVACGPTHDVLAPYTLVPSGAFNVKMTLGGDEATGVWKKLTGCSDSIKSMTLYMSTTTVNIVSDEFWQDLVLVGTATTDVNIMVPYTQTASHVFMGKRFFYTTCGTMLCLSSDMPYTERKPVSPSLEYMAGIQTPDAIDIRLQRNMRFTGTISLSNMTADGYLYLGIPLSTLNKSEYHYAYIPGAEVSISADGALLNNIYSYYKGVLLKYIALSSEEMVWLDSAIDMLKDAYIHIDVFADGNDFLLSVYFPDDVPAYVENALYFVRQRYPRVDYITSSHMLVISTVKDIHTASAIPGTINIHVSDIATLKSTGPVSIPYIGEISGVDAHLSYFSKDALLIHVSLKR